MLGDECICIDNWRNMRVELALFVSYVCYVFHALDRLYNSLTSRIHDISYVELNEIIGVVIDVLVIWLLVQRCL